MAKNESDQSPCSWRQATALAMKFAINDSDNPDWVLFRRIRACLWANGKEGKLSYEDASDLFDVDELPEKYYQQIDNVVEQYRQGRIPSSGQEEESDSGEIDIELIHPPDSSND